MTEPGQTGCRDPAGMKASERGAPSTLTPMMRQYFSVKSEHPSAIVLFRMGDFFETFYEDAAECARLLDLTLTARSKEKDPVPMAGVPHHAIEGYISRLIDFGKTVVLVDQVEDPRQAKGLVKRAVTGVLSPGTFLDPNAPPRLSTYLVALALSAPRASGRARPSAPWGIAALDLSTGEFRATSGDDEDLLFDELGRIGMREVLIAEGFEADPRVARLKRDLPKVAVTFVPAADLSRRSAREALVRTLGEPEVRGVEAVLNEEALAAAGAALAYAERMQPKRDGQSQPALLHVKELRPYLPGDALVLDVEACEHLELFRAAGDRGRTGSLLGAIDEATTAMGGRLLARWLAYPSRDPAVIAERQDAIEALCAAPSQLDRIREILKGVADLERLVGRVVMGRSTPRDLGALRGTLDRVPALFESVGRASSGVVDPELASTLGGALEAREPAPAKSRLLARLSNTDPASDAKALLEAALVEDPPADLELGEVFRRGFDKELDRLTELSANGKGLIARMEAEEKEKTGIGSLKVRYNRVFGYYIEVTRPNLKLVPAHYIRKQTTANGERFFTDALRALEAEVLSAEEKRAERTEALFEDLIASIAKQAERLVKVARAAAEADVLSGLAHLAVERGWVRPIVDDSGVIEIVDGRHPVLEQMSEALKERFVPNDLTISSERSLMIITGPNMAGKSTIMRQTALIVILAHMGSFVPARSARIGLVDRIFTRVGASDDLSRGRSTFMVEMNETARILRSATSRSLILLDEIGRGTSTFDGLSIAWAVAEHLHDQIGAKTLFATHYHELTEICRDKPRAVNHHVAVKEWNDEIVFLRKLLPGSTNRSYGVQVARLAGLPPKVVERARAVLASLEAQALSAGDGSPVAQRAGSSEGPRGQKPDAAQLFLFGGLAATTGERRADDLRLAEIGRALEAISIDDITPRRALEELARLKELWAGPSSTQKR